jgi:dUTP pyrophosphatase
MAPVYVKVINRSVNPLPEYQTEHAAGLDLRASLPGAVTLEPMQRQLIPTGLFIELPAGYEAQVRPRSGLAFKHGVTVLNSPGTIDADYRGEVMVLLINLSGQPFVVQPGERIAQLVVAAYQRIAWQPAGELSETGGGRAATAARARRNDEHCTVKRDTYHHTNHF